MAEGRDPSDRRRNAITPRVPAVLSNTMRRPNNNSNTTSIKTGRVMATTTTGMGTNRATTRVMADNTMRGATEEEGRRIKTTSRNTMTRGRPGLAGEAARCPAEEGPQ
jgi:hypothetical protein